MRREICFLVTILALFSSALSTLGAVPRQGERPPQPFFQDFFSGTVTVLGAPAPAGAQLIACIDDCAAGFESQPVQVGQEGSYSTLEMNPSDEALIGHTVSFYLVNEFGRIKAVETRAFVGVFNFYIVDLTFNERLPTAPLIPTVTPTASLPVPGDPGVTAIPRLALIVGAAAVAAGTGLLLLARHRTE